MLKFLKSFGLGLLYMILMPILLVILALYAIYGLYNFFVELIKALVRFFSGKPFFPPFEEDIKAERILNRGLDADKPSETAPAAPAPTTTNVYVQQNIYQNAPANPNPAPNPLPGIPTMRIPNIPGVDPQALEQANGQLNQTPIPSIPTIDASYTPPQIESGDTPKDEEEISLNEDDEYGQF